MSMNLHASYEFIKDASICKKNVFKLERYCLFVGIYDFLISLIRLYKEINDDNN